MATQEGEVSKWTHRVCGNCYEHFEPGRQPVRLPGESGYCCSCGETTDEGIFYRFAPGALPCKGEHETEAPK